MLSKIIIGANAKSVDLKVEEILNELNLGLNSPDVLVVDDKTGIPETRKVREFLSIKPIGRGYKCVIFTDLSTISPLAQNSLLKSIEDINENGVVLMKGKAQDQAIATLQSRMEIIILNEEGVEIALEPIFQEWIEADIAQRFKIIEKVEDKKGFLGGLSSWVGANMRHDKTWVEFANKLLEAEQFIKANGNQRAVLEWLALGLPVGGLGQKL